MPYILLIAIVVAAIVTLRAVSAVRSALDKRFDSVDEKMEKLQQFTEDFEYRTLKPEEKVFRKFEHADRLTLSDIEHFKEGEVFHLASCSYIYPSSEPEMLLFDYKHGSLGQQSTVAGKTYVSVNGFWQLGEDEKWRPYTFHASADTCMTNSFEGEIRRLHSRRF